jgi:snapalysin
MMLFKRLSALLFAIATMAGLQVVTAGPAAAAPRTLYYDTSQAQEFKAVVDQGAQIWNSRVANVRLVPVPSGRTPNIRVYADNGWPRAQTTSLGNGRMWMGREAVNDGYLVVRIAAHELGHLLGLPDRRTGLCSDLMSGSSAPVSCQNAYPNATEANTVNNNFRSSAAVPAQTFVWSAAA